MTFALLGYPLTHSFSKGYFTEKFVELGIADTHRYVNWEQEQFLGFEKILEEYDDLRGMNVTLPHKQNVISHLDVIDPVAERIGAVNCIRFNEQGRSTGYNTDYLGFQSDFLDFLREYDWTGQAFGLPQTDDLLDVFLPETSALVLGTGGASLAVHEALRQLGVTTVAVSRRPGPNRITYEDITPTLLADHHLVVNATPLGMYPKVDTAPAIPYAALSPAHFCYDLVYNPNPTLFLQKAAAAGAGTGAGIRMLHRQAEAGWRIWMGDGDRVEK